MMLFAVEKIFNIFLFMTQKNVQVASNFYVCVVIAQHFDKVSAV
jgi:hypothetical protein